MHSKTARARTMAAAVLALGLSACVVYPNGAIGPAVGFAPPAVRVEAYGVAPVPGYIWLPGYWSWGGRSYAWVGGYWAAPRPGYRWAPNHWVYRGDGWHMAGGRWVRR